MGLRIFVSYSHKDEAYRSGLVTALAGLQRQGIVDTWTDRNIGAGAVWLPEIQKNLDSCDVALLLISADFIASEFIYSKELSKLLDRHESGAVTVIPIIIRACLFQAERFGSFQFLPKDARPVADYDNPDVAWTEIAAAIWRIAQTRKSEAPSDFPAKRSRWS